MTTTTEEQLLTYMSLFRGRNDIYARRWEKGNKSGYSPAYSFDWNEFLRHKAQGGTINNFENKQNLPLTREVIHKHLLGKHVVGIYPLLLDNSSYFIVADFDGRNWLTQSKEFIKECRSFGITSYLERSRSGQGSHVWIFFEENYPANKSRAILLELLRKTFNVSQFEKEVSFDRLFPNQDFHTGKGFGNLIALPLQGESVKEENSMFIDIKSNKPYQDQWKFLEDVKRVSAKQLDNVYDKLFSNNNKDLLKPKTGKLLIEIDNQIYIPKHDLDSRVIKFLKESLNFYNTEYLIKQRIGKSVYGVEKYFKLISEDQDRVMIPRGFITELKTFCDENEISYKIVDKRKKLPSIEFKSKINLFGYQINAVEQSEIHDYGVIVAPPGSGKTIMGLELIARKKQPALIVVHRQQLMDQWTERIQSFLKIKKQDIGEISGRKKNIGKEITVAMVQSLVRQESLLDFQHLFGTIIVDECHHIPAKSFRNVIVKLNSYYLYGLTATPKRKYNDEKLIFFYIGDILCQLGKDYRTAKQIKDPIVNIRDTELSVPFENLTDDYQLLSKVLVFDTARNIQISEDIIEQVKLKRKILVLTDRKDHVQILNLYLKKSCETITLTGDDSKTSKQSKFEQIQLGHFQVLIATGQLFGEGIDIKNLDCLFIVYPLSFEGKLEQYIGRIQRSSKKQFIFDYRDKNVEFLEKMFKKRNRFYKKILNQK